MHPIPSHATTSELQNREAIIKHNKQCCSHHMPMSAKWTCEQPESRVPLLRAAFLGCLWFHLLLGSWTKTNDTLTWETEESPMSHMDKDVTGLVKHSGVDSWISHKHSEPKGQREWRCLKKSVHLEPGNTTCLSQREQRLPTWGLARRKLGLWTLWLDIMAVTISYSSPCLPPAKPSPKLEGKRGRQERPASSVKAQVGKDDSRAGRANKDHSVHVSCH